MKLTWAKRMYLGDLATQALIPESRYDYLADGESSSYAITFSDGWWAVKQFNANGEMVKNNRTLTLDGAKARAQAWEGS
ncbi:hypothetical protein [Mycobacterium phage Azrael100]|uniref:Uncharacterized protein n=1 Tax=Mycobacterium phage Cosmo TaxID=1567467 RepID=A0A0B5A2T0_9CAUD|nr:hypothetical protein COSMO_12 [Mycobacterium phage Cosmo]WKR36032.1 hypothetical protein [Mycobacterium phage Azrael100]